MPPISLHSTGGAIMTTSVIHKANGYNTDGTAESTYTQIIKAQVQCGNMLQANDTV